MTVQLPFLSEDFVKLFLDGAPLRQGPQTVLLMTEDYIVEDTLADTHTSDHFFIQICTLHAYTLYILKIKQMFQQKYGQTIEIVKFKT